MSNTAELYARDLRRIRRLATEILRQCDHFERNTADGKATDDDCRFWIIQNDALKLLRASVTPANRASLSCGFGATRLVIKSQETVKPGERDPERPG